MKSSAAPDPPPEPDPEPEPDRGLASEQLSIGALAGRFGLATHVLRHWEAVGLLEPARDRNGRRRYQRHHVVRVAVILRAKDAGLGLDAIRAMIAAPGATARRAALSEQRDVITDRIAGLRTSLEIVECALNCEHHDFTRCPHFQQVIADLPESGPAVRGGGPPGGRDAPPGGRTQPGRRLAR